MLDAFRSPTMMDEPATGSFMGGVSDLFREEPRRKQLRPYQTEALEKLRSSLRAGRKRPVLQLPTGGGKCLGHGTPVVLASGQIVPVQDVKVGDRLASPTGEPVTVLSLARGREELFRITPVKGDPWVCNASHLLSVKTTQTGCTVNFADGQAAKGTKGEILTIRAVDLFNSTKTARLVVKQWRPAQVQFDTVGALLIPPYAFGVWLGDGTSLSPDVSKPFSAVADAWIEYAQSQGCRIRISYGSTGCPTYHAVTERGQVNPALDRLRDLGVLGRKHIPTAYKTASLSDRLRLLAGIFDTDGYAHNCGVDFISKYRELAEDVAFVCRSVGLAAYVRECKKGIASTGFEGTYWRVGVSGDLSALPTRRLKIQVRTQKKDHLVTGFTIEPIGEGDYYGFELSGDRLFMLGDFTVTHNTLVAANIVQGALAKGKRVMFTVPALSLVNQTVAAFRAEGIDDIGVWQSSHPLTNPDAVVQVATVQTLGRRASCPDFDFAIVDEAHIHDKGLAQRMASSPGKIFIGLSATPWAKGLGKTYDDLIIGTTIRDLISDGYLSDFRAYAPAHPDLSGVDVRRGEYDQGQLADVMSERQVVADVVTTWLEKGEDRPTLCFAVDRAHAAKLQADFEANGVPAGYVDCNTDSVERDLIRRRFEAGEIRVVCNCRTLTTGVDWAIGCIIDAQPTRSEMLHVQKIGRGLRVNPGIPDLIILDHADNSLRLGLVTDIYHETLDAGDRNAAAPPKKREALPKECSKCSFLKPAKVHECPVCGFKPERVSSVEHEDGELVEITGKAVKPKKPEYTRAQKQRWYSELLGYCHMHGKKEGYAYHQYLAKFKVTPQGLAKNPITPGWEVISYCKAAAIRFAKAKGEKRDAA